MLDLHKLIKKEIQKHLAPLIEETAKELKELKEKELKNQISLYSYKDLQNLFGKSKETIFRWIKNGDLPKEDFKVGSNPFWYQTTIKQFLEERKHESMAS